MSMHIFVSDRPSVRHLTGEPVELVRAIGPSTPFGLKVFAEHGPAYELLTTQGERICGFAYELEFWYQCP